MIIIKKDLKTLLLCYKKTLLFCDFKHLFSDKKILLLGDFKHFYLVTLNTYCVTFIL